MSQSLATVAYLGAAILFILSLGGLSNPETSRRGNLLGMVGMALAVLATVFGPRVGPSGLAWIVGALAIGGGIGLYAARVVKMTQMPELVALMHSLVGLAACLVGFASYVDTAILLEGVEKTIHEVEIYIGILIGAITFSGSLIAFGKFKGRNFREAATDSELHGWLQWLAGSTNARSASMGQWYLAQLKAGAPVALAGSLKVSTWQAKDGATRATSASMCWNTALRPIRPCATERPWATFRDAIFSTKKTCSPDASRSGVSSMLTYSSPLGV